MSGHADTGGSLRVIKGGAAFLRLRVALLLMLTAAEQMCLAQSVGCGESAADDKVAIRQERQNKDQLRGAPRILLPASTTTSGVVDPFEVCPAESSACYDDTTCLECVTTVMPINETECSRLYPILLEPHNAASPTTGSVTPAPVVPAWHTAECEELAALICCTFDMLVNYDCTGSELTVDFWECGLQYKGCSIEELPCYSNIAGMVGNQMTDSPVVMTDPPVIITDSTVMITDPPAMTTDPPVSSGVGESTSENDVTPSPASITAADGAGGSLSAGSARWSLYTIQSGMFAFVALGVLVFWS